MQSNKGGENTILHERNKTWTVPIEVEDKLM
jgi:hypothetical protein